MSNLALSRREKGSSIKRVMAMIAAIARAERPLSPADLAEQLDIPKPSVHRLLGQLADEGYVQLNMRGLIVPGFNLEEVALGVIYSGRFKALRQAILQRLTDEIGETCGIAIPNGAQMIYYDRVQSAWPLQVHLPVGSQTPVWCTASGKLYLSSLPRERRQRILQQLPLQRFARNTLTEPQALEAELAQIATTEVGIDREEFVDGMVACAVPIKDRGGRLFACLFTHAPLIRQSLDRLQMQVPRLRQAAVELGALIDDTEVVN